jgi:hypothetical protein
MTNDSIESVITELEERRCRALVAKNIGALAELVADDVVHIHTNGQVEGKSSYLETVTERIDFLEVTRESHKVRHIRETVLTHGILRQQLRLVSSGAIVNMRALVSQVWCQADRGWQQTLFHATLIS